MRVKARAVLRWAIPLTALAGLIGWGWWTLRSPEFAARRLISELGGSRPGRAERWLIALGLVESRPARAPLAVAGELIAIGQPAVGPLLEALRTGDLETRRWAGWALSEIGPSDPGAAAALAAALGDEDATVRACAAGALGKMGASAAPAVEALIAALADENPAVAITAEQALAQIVPSLPAGPTADRAAEALRRARQRAAGEDGGFRAWPEPIIPPLYRSSPPG